MDIDIDFRLGEVSIELYALDEYLNLIENQMEYIKKQEKLRVDAYLRREGLYNDEAERGLAYQEYYHTIDFILPRFFRGPFLVSLYAVYESAVTEIAHLIREKQSQKLTINDLTGDFLTRTKKYYEHIIKFDLFENNTAWQKIKMLSIIRNAYAHANGRINMLSSKVKKKINNWEKQKIGISTHGGFLICEQKISAEIFNTVRGSLEDLIDRYKNFDDKRMQG